LFDAGRAPGAPPVGPQGLREQEPVLLPNGTRADEAPGLPAPEREPTVLLQAYALPGARDVDGLFQASVLQADPNDVASVVTAVKAAIDADRARFGVPSSELRLVSARKFAGHGDLADTVYLHFRQIKDNVLVHGASLSITVKILGGKPTIVAQTGRLYPELDVDTAPTLTDDQIMDKIARRVGIPAAEAASHFQFAEEKILYSRGAWRHAKLYVAEGLPFMVAVDLATGEVFAWDNRTALKEKKPKAAPAKGSGVSGTVAGKTVVDGPIMPGAKVDEIPLGFLYVTVGGKTYVTDKDGRFSADPSLKVGPAGLTLSAELAGPHVKVVDDEHKDLAINVTIKPGDGAFKAVFNPNSNLEDENALAQVAAFMNVNGSYEFLHARGLTTEDMDKRQIPITTNINQDCNAYYTPGSPSFHTFKASADCVNSAYNTVVRHEYGHYWDDETGGIMNGGLSEGWGDTLSMYDLNNPIVGEHFLKHPGPDGKDYIRSGENSYKYNEYDEVHDQGQAWGGFNWMLRAAMIEKLGYEKGKAMAEALVLPTMFAKAATIPAAMAQVLVSAMKKDGTLAFEAEIRKVALFHGVTLPANPGVAASLLPSSWSSVRLTSTSGPAVPPGGAPSLAGPESASADAPAAPAGPESADFSAGRLARGAALSYVRGYLDFHGVRYTLTKVRGGLSGATYRLTMSGGSPRAIANLVRKLRDGSLSL
ncbi:MAG: hypothetical protein KGM24_12210, partial [Elusimicrobia bacterium]|nr:hypothetical protein [Elusimicrobiota bacterium]